MKISIFSHFSKGSSDAVKGVKRGNKVKEDPVYISFLVEIPKYVEDSVTGQYFESHEPDTRLVVTGCRLSDGMLRPPALAGRFAGSFFPFLFFPKGLDNPMADTLYSLTAGVARRYGVPILEKEDCLAGWLTTEKAVKNYKNLPPDLGEIELRT